MGVPAIENSGEIERGGDPAAGSSYIDQDKRREKETGDGGDQCRKEGDIHCSYEVSCVCSNQEREKPVVVQLQLNSRWKCGAISFLLFAVLRRRLCIITYQYCYIMLYPHPFHSWLLLSVFSLVHGFLE